MDDQLRADFLRVRIAKGNHLRELVTRIDVKQRKWNLAGAERLLREPQHHRRIFADRIHHHGMRKHRHRFAQNVDSLGLELSKMAPTFSCSQRLPLTTCSATSALDFRRRDLDHFSRFPFAWTAKTKNPPASISGGGFLNNLTRLVS